MTDLVTPEIVAKALASAPAEYAQMHRMNSEHPMVRGCKLGAVFAHNGEYLIYLGLNGRNRRFPLIALNVATGSRRKMTADFFARVRAASQEG